MCMTCESVKVWTNFWKRKFTIRENLCQIEHGLQFIAGLFGFWYLIQLWSLFLWYIFIETEGYFFFINLTSICKLLHQVMLQINNHKYPSCNSPDKVIYFLFFCNQIHTVPMSSIVISIILQNNCIKEVSADIWRWLSAEEHWTHPSQFCCHYADGQA